VRVAAAAAHFGRDLDACLHRIEAIVRHARRAGVKLLVLPHGTLGGHLADGDDPGPDDLPPMFTGSEPVFASVRALAGDMVICLGYTERVGPERFDTAVCLTGDGVLGRHRKVHQPPGEAVWYSSGDDFTAFETPVGRLGLLVDYDKTFPEAARSLAVDGAQVIACLSAWPSTARRASERSSDRQVRLFDLYDVARAAENQVFVVSANQTGVMGRQQFLGHAKVVDPSGQQLARTGPKAGLAVCEIDLDDIAATRAQLNHLDERRLDAYRMTPVAPPRTGGPGRVLASGVLRSTR
jgi:predicted amidohydrolase